LKLDRPEEVIEPARHLIAISETMAFPHLQLANALAALKRLDEAVQVWVDSLKTLRGADRRVIPIGISSLAEGHPELTDSQIQTLVTVLTTLAADTENPIPQANAVALTLRADRLEKDPAVQRALRQQAVPWDALAHEQTKKIARGDEGRGRRAAASLSGQAPLARAREEPRQGSPRRFATSL